MRPDELDRILAAQDRLAAVRTVLHLERWRTVERLRRCGTDWRRLLLETTGLEGRCIVITVRLNPMAQLTQHLHHDRPLPVAFEDGFFAPIVRSRDQGNVCFNLRLQIRR